MNDETKQNTMQDTKEETRVRLAVGYESLGGPRFIDRGKDTPTSPMGEEGWTRETEDALTFETVGDVLAFVKDNPDAYVRTIFKLTTTRVVREETTVTQLEPK